MAYSATATTGPTEFGGVYRLIVKNVTPDAATGSIVFSELTSVDAIVAVSYGGTLTGNCYSLDAKINVTTVNQVDFELWKAGGTAADTAFLPVWITVIGH